MAAHDPDLPFFEWAVGLFVAAFAAALGHVHVRINREEDQRVKGTTEGIDAMTGTEAKLWRALDEHRREFQQFRGIMMETTVRRADLRADLHDMEARQTQALREMESRILAILRLPQGERAP